ncbi:MAG: alanine--glyoxylate aminotransferase family protein [Bacteroidota bacterium]
MKHHLLTPGPVPIPTFVQEAIAQPVIHHRTAAFHELYRDLLEKMRYLFQTKEELGLAMGSGTYGVEMAMYSLFKPGSEVLVLENGKFSERWKSYGRTMNLSVRPMTKSWGQGFQPKEVLEMVKKLPSLKGVVITHCETSTGNLLDLEEISLALRQERPELLLLVDGITTIGAVPFYLDAWGIDLAITASQKALMNPAGTFLFAMSERAFQEMPEPHPGDFRHLKTYAQQARNAAFPFTAPVQLMYGLKAALDQVTGQGLPHIWQQVHHTARTFRQGIKDLGGHMLAEQPSDSLTAFSFPKTDHEKLRGRLTDQHGFELSGGQGELKGHLLRISHMGSSADPDLMQAVLEAIKKEIRS